MVHSELAERRAAWLHIPKCGTSFATTLVHYVDPSLPDNVVLPPCHPGVGCEDALLKRKPSLRRHLWMHETGHWADHESLTDKAFAQFNGSIFAFFREPRRRLASMWYFFSPGFRLTRHRANRIPHINVSFYAARVAGSATLMVTGQRHGLECLAAQFPCTQVGQPNVALALSRLDGFAFVGLTEEWSLSICLFHAMFGGRCLPGELGNARPTPRHRGPIDKLYGDINASSGLPAHHSSGKSGGSHPTSHAALLETLQRATDAADEALYAAVERRFWADVRRHNVTREGCVLTCPTASHRRV